MDNNNPDLKILLTFFEMFNIEPLETLLMLCIFSLVKSFQALKYPDSLC